ncbi:hypothetical protein, partial [Anaerotignum lactatifermentans]|uniref:hypothetical protein n=1 Tax=Anaerotignum lactatifermentans TaxID=160404 RepID=UPI0030797536
ISPQQKRTAATTQSVRHFHRHFPVFPSIKSLPHCFFETSLFLFYDCQSKASYTGKENTDEQKANFQTHGNFCEKRESPKQIFLKKTLGFLDFLRRIATAGFSRNISYKIL